MLWASVRASGRLQKHDPGRAERTASMYHCRMKVRYTWLRSCKAKNRKHKRSNENENENENEETSRSQGSLRALGCCTGTNPLLFLIWGLFFHTVGRRPAAGGRRRRRRSAGLVSPPWRDSGRHGAMCADLQINSRARGSWSATLAGPPRDAARARGGCVRHGAARAGRVGSGGLCSCAQNVMEGGALSVPELGGASGTHRRESSHLSWRRLASAPP